MRQKECIKCGIIQKLNQFTRDKTKKMGRRSICKQCRNIKVRTHKEKDPLYEHKRYIKRKSKGYYFKINTKFNNAKNSAKSNKFIWILSIEEYTKIINFPCIYCGSELPKIGSGLDRKNSLGHYSKTNVVPCCSICNKVKNNIFSYEEMLKLGKVIKEIRENKING